MKEDFPLGTAIVVVVVVVVVVVADVVVTVSSNDGAFLVSDPSRGDGRPRREYTMTKNVCHKGAGTVIGPPGRCAMVVVDCVLR
jgi:uncharacterized membrane protein YqiK